MSIAVLADLDVAPEHVPVLRAALLALAEHVAQEDGTELFAVNQDVDRPGHFVVFERYRDAAAVAEHRSSAAMTGFRDALRSAGVVPTIVFLTPLAGVGVRPGTH